MFKFTKPELKTRLVELGKWSGVVLISFFSLVLLSVIIMITTKKDVIIDNTQTAKEYNLVYYTIKGEKASVLLYDIKKKKHKEIFSVNVKSDERYYFSVDYSTEKNIFAYSDINGISTYNPETKETKEIIKNNLAEEDGVRNDMESVIYMNPKISPNGEKLLYKTGHWGPCTLTDINGQNSQSAECPGKYVWAPDSSGYATNQQGMEMTSGLNVSLSDPITKIRQILPSNKNAFITDLQYSRDGSKLIINPKYFTQTATDFTETKARLSIIKINGEELKDLDEDEFDNQSIVVADDNVYYSKISQQDKISKGIYSINIESGDKSEFYSNNGKFLSPQSYRDNWLVFLEDEVLYNTESIKILKMISSDKKDFITIGEGSAISFVNWVDSSKNLGDLTEIQAPVATDEEKTAYVNSLKTRGYLYQSYYEYCWEYDCNAEKYPYSKKTTGEIPEIIELNSAPVQLTGKVSIPVVFMYSKEPFVDSHLAIIKDQETQYTMGEIEKWLNEQAAKKGQSLSFSLDYKSDQLKLDLENEACYKYQGTSKYISYDCLQNTAKAKYPTIDQAPIIITIVAKEYGENLNFEYSYNPKFIIKSVYTKTSKWENGASTIVTKSDDDIQNSLKYEFGNSYIVPSLLKIYGAKDKFATYKSPSDKGVSACLVGDKTDIMCRAYWDNDNKNVNYISNLVELEIGDITAKELGWYDADGDNKKEVDDKCPFDSSNNCK